MRHIGEGKPWPLQIYIYCIYSTSKLKMYRILVLVSCPISAISIPRKIFFYVFLTHLWVKSSWNMSDNNSTDSTDICNHGTVAETQSYRSIS